MLLIISIIGAIPTAILWYVALTTYRISILWLPSAFIQYLLLTQVDGAPSPWLFLIISCLSMGFFLWYVIQHYAAKGLAGTSPGWTLSIGIMSTASYLGMMALAMRYLLHADVTWQVAGILCSSFVLLFANAFLVVGPLRKTLMRLMVRSAATDL